jgi:hypothetical protein
MRMFTRLIDLEVLTYCLAFQSLQSQNITDFNDRLGSAHVRRINVATTQREPSIRSHLRSKQSFAESAQLPVKLALIITSQFTRADFVIDTLFALSVNGCKSRRGHQILYGLAVKTVSRINFARR